MKIVVTFTVDDDPEVVDAADPCGLTSDAYDALFDELFKWGATDIDVQQVRDG